MKVFLHLKPNYTPRTISFKTCWWIFCKKYWTYFKTCWLIFCQNFWTYCKTWMDGFVARPPDRTLHDPCWRAARARTVEEKPRWQQQPTFESFEDRKHFWWSKSKIRAMTVDNCRVYQWEERLGIEREQSLSKSSPDLSRLVGLDVVTISLCMLDWSAMRYHNSSYFCSL